MREHETTSFDQLEKFCEEVYKEQKDKGKKVFLLSGGVGAGKTTFTSTFIKKNLCSDDEEFEKLQVMSPTFSVINVYETPKLRIAHIDLYRISEKDFEVEELLEEVEASDYSFIEWPSKIKGFERFLNSNCLKLNFKILEDQKRLVEVIT